MTLATVNDLAVKHGECHPASSWRRALSPAFAMLCVLAGSGCQSLARTPFSYAELHASSPSAIRPNSALALARASRDDNYPTSATFIRTVWRAVQAQIGLDHEALGLASDEHEEAAQIRVPGWILTRSSEREADQIFVRERQSEVRHVANFLAIRTVLSGALRTALER